LSLNAEIWFEMCKIDHTISEEFWYINILSLTDICVQCERFYIVNQIKISFSVTCRVIIVKINKLIIYQDKKTVYMVVYN